MGWQDDPLVADKPTKGAAPWEADPVVKAHDDSKHASTAPVASARDTARPDRNSGRTLSDLITGRKTAQDGATGTFARGAAQGLTFNFADEAFAGLDAISQPLTGFGSDAPSIGQRYENNLVSQRQRYKEDATEHPIADISGNVLGSIVGAGKIAKAAKGVVGLAKEGAKAGALYGFGAGEGGITERAKSAAEGAALGAGTGAALGGASAAFQYGRPANVAARYVKKQFATPAAADSAAVAQEVGQYYTPGQATGSKGLLTIEGLVRRHPASADKMAAFDNRQLDTSLRYLGSTLNDITKAKASPDIVGDKVAGAFDDVVSKAVSTRRNTAKADFGRVDELVNSEKDRLYADALGQHAAEVQAITAENSAAADAAKAVRDKQFKPGAIISSPQVAVKKLPEPPSKTAKFGVVLPSNLSASIDDLVTKFSAPGGGDASNALVEQAKRLKASLPKDGKRLTANETQRLLQIYGSASKGTGAVFKDLDTGQQRLIAGQLQNALLADVDAAAEEGSHIGAISDALKTARNNYRQNSQAIDGLENSVLGRLFGGKYERAPERIAAAVKNMTPTELRSSFAILSKSDPEVAQVTKRYLVEDALNTAGRTNTAAPQAQVAGEATFSPAKYLTAIRKSPVWDTLNPQERLQMTASVRDLERLNYRAGTDGSPTAPLMAALGIITRPTGRIAAGAATGASISALTGGDIKEGAFAGAVGGGAGGLAIPRIARAITTPEGQMALRTIRQSKPGSAAYTAATGVLVNIFTAPDEPKPKL